MRCTLARSASLAAAGSLLARSTCTRTCALPALGGRLLEHNQHISCLLIICVLCRYTYNIVKVGEERARVLQGITASTDVSVVWAAVLMKEMLLHMHTSAT